MRKCQVALINLVYRHSTSAIINMIIATGAYETLQNLGITTRRFSLKLLQFHHAFSNVSVSSQKITLFYRR